jgi:hypothetical protein
MERSRNPPPAPSTASQLSSLRLGLETLLVLVLTTVCTVFALRPLYRDMGHLLGPGMGDPLYLLIVLKWNLRQLRLGLPDPLGLPIFHPTPDALALSDHIYGPSLAAWPVAAATDPVTAFNTVLMATFALAGASAYWLFRRIGLSRGAALFGALAFAFSPWRFSQTPHLQMLLVAAVPPLLWFWDRLLRPTGRWPAALGFVAFYGIHVFGGMYLTLMVHVPMAVFLVLRARSPEGGGWRDWWENPARRRLLAVTAVVSGLFLAGTLAPYLVQDTGVSLDRGDWSLRTYGATTLSLVTPSNFAWYWPAVGPRLEAVATGYQAPGRLSEKSLFAGFLPTLLALAALFALFRRRRSGPRRARPRDVLAVAGLVLAGVAFLAADLYTWRLPVPPPPAPEAQRVGEVYDVLLGLLLLGLGTWWWLRLKHPAREPAAANGPRRVPTFADGLLWSSAACLLLAFPVFYEPVADLVPGFDKMRVSARFYALASLGLTYLAGRGLDGLLGRLSSNRRFSKWSRGSLAAAVLVLLAAELAPTPLPFQRLPREPGFPPVHHWIAEHDEVEVYVTLPFGSRPSDELFAMYFASGHFKPILNGYSGHHPPAYSSLRNLCCTVPPDEQELAALRRRGTTHVLIEVDRLGPGELALYRPWREQVLAGRVPGVREVFSGRRKERVYSIVP